MATAMTISAVQPRAHKPVFQLPPDRPATPSTYFKSPFDPEKHLVYNGLPKRHTMEELSFPPDLGISPIGVSEPFKLFSEEAVRHMRNEVLSDEVWDNCRFASSIAACQLRGMAPKYVLLFPNTPSIVLSRDSPSLTVKFHPFHHSFASTRKS